jgi:hypothetical protein
MKEGLSLVLMQIIKQKLDEEVACSSALPGSCCHENFSGKKSLLPVTCSSSHMTTGFMTWAEPPDIPGIRHHLSSTSFLFS